MKTSIIFTSTTEHLIGSLKKKAGNLEFILPEKNKEGERFFPDGEVYARLPQIKNLRNKKVVVLHSGAPRPNDSLIELELILHILKDHEIRPELFFTYFPYGQQDRAFQRGEVNVAESLIKKLINYYGVKKIYMIDPHFGKMEWFEKYRLTSVSMIPFLIKKAQEDFGSPSQILPGKTWEGKDILFLSPDKGGKRRTGILGLKKKRINSFQVESFSPKKVLKGKVVGVIDDILETGGTLLKFLEVIKKSGVNDVFALITHGLLDSGIKRIGENFSKIYLTNTINRKEANVDITDLIVDTLIKNREDL